MKLELAETRPLRELDGEPDKICQSESLAMLYFRQAMRRLRYSLLVLPLCCAIWPDIGECDNIFTASHGGGRKTRNGTFS